MIDLTDYRRALGSFPTGAIIVSAFDGTTWQAAPNGAPVLPSAASQLEYSVQARIDGEDHAIILGLVESYTHHPTAPLVYFCGSFFAAPQPEVTT